MYFATNRPARSVRRLAYNRLLLRRPLADQIAHNGCRRWNNRNSLGM
jgi:hypothetical protein